MKKGAPVGEEARLYTQVVPLYGPRVSLPVTFCAVSSEKDVSRAPSTKIARGGAPVSKGDPSSETLYIGPLGPQVKGELRVPRDATLGRVATPRKKRAVDCIQVYRYFCVIILFAKKIFQKMFIFIV